MVVTDGIELRNGEGSLLPMSVLLYDIRGCRLAVARRVQLCECRKRHESLFCNQVYLFCGL
jgi:hypothetical protein